MKMILFRYVVYGITRCCTISTDQLMDAIAAVESHRGATSANVYQLTQIYVDDVSRISGQPVTLKQATESDAMARCCISTYWRHYGHWYYRVTGRVADAETLARIHNGGPDGWRRMSTLAYWRKVKAALLAGAACKEEPNE